MKLKSLLHAAATILTLCFINSSTVFASDRLACESRDGRREYCDVGGARDADIELSRQLSDARCERGESWGRNDHGVWVDHGCRAEFTVYRRYDSNDRRPDYGYRDPPAREQCPAGFEPGNHHCSQDERRRGCKDMRMPGGTTCSSHGWGYQSGRR